MVGIVRDLIFGHINILNPGLALVINLFVICAVSLLVVINQYSDSGFFGNIGKVVNEYTRWINNLWNKDIKNTPHVILPKWLDGEENYTIWLIWFLILSLIIIVPIILGQRVRLLDGLLNAGYFNFFYIILIILNEIE